MKLTKKSEFDLDLDLSLDLSLYQDLISACQSGALSGMCFERSFTEVHSLQNTETNEGDWPTGSVEGGIYQDLIYTGNLGKCGKCMKSGEIEHLTGFAGE